MLLSVDERIIAMTDPQCLPGELEIVAASKVLKRKIVVVGENNNEITSYGDNSLQKLYVRFRNIGNDVGHYDSFVLATPSRGDPPTASPARSLEHLLQEPSMPKRKRTSR